MGILDDAKDKLGDAAEWVKDKAENLGEQAQGAGQTLGEKAADARHWAESKLGGDSGEPQRFAGGAAEERTADGGSFATEWVDASTDQAADAPQAEPSAEASHGGDHPQHPAA
ncbi:hypothetical protein FQ330_12280 [Agrococcus sediminis]|uniref:Antitoxin n=1 Tax=Agrococcus sediminis TaxID=2599924 RepID=A0A5M8Q4X9_9MICO|nr:hypothetical protein [Agrococcus sediminis]KAA6430937.1 hypothetical protein FQ330_12280 [Agrococcus sediminis]